MLQDARVSGRTGGRLLQNRKLELVEKNFAELQGRTDVELLTGNLVNRSLQTLSLGFESFFQFREAGEVDHDAGPFHLREHGQERHLDLIEQTPCSHRFELRLEQVTKLQSHVGVLARVFGRAAERNLIV